MSDDIAYIALQCLMYFMLLLVLPLIIVGGLVWLICSLLAEAIGIIFS